MPKPKRAAECGIGNFWKVRVIMPGSVIHLASSTEPVVTLDETSGRVSNLDFEPINGTEHGDTVGFIDWPAVSAVTWRKA